MTVESPSTPGGSDNGPPSGRKWSLRPTGLPKPLRKGSQETTRRVQIRSVLKQLTLDRHTASMAIKASIPPTILLCVIQSNAWISHFGTQAYLAAIMSVCVMPALPRARLLEYNCQLAFAVAVSFCWVLLGGWCSLEARKNTSHSLEQMTAYNSSAEAVAAIFLMFLTWCVFTLKSAFPTWNIQCTWAGIFAVSTLPTIAQASTMPEIINEASTTVEAFLAGQAIGFVNALVIFPQSCRGVFRKDMEACLEGLVNVMRAQKRCTEDFRLKTVSVEAEDERNSSVNQLQIALQAFINSVVKARGDVEYAEREVAWDRLDHSDLDHIASILVDLIPPVFGLGSTADMLQLAVDGSHQSTTNTGGMNGNTGTGDHSRKEEEYWRGLEDKMHEQSYRISDAIIEGAEHAKRRLELKSSRSLFRKAHARKADEENQAFSMNPGKASFLESYREVFGKCSVLGQDISDMEQEKLLDHYVRHRPQIRDLSQIDPEAHSNTLRYFLLLHVSETIW